MGKMMSKIWRYYVINFIKDQENMNEIVAITNLDTIYYLLNGEKNDNKNFNLPVRLMHVVDNYGIIIDDTKEDLEP